MPKNSSVADIFQLEDEADNAFNSDLEKDVDPFSPGAITDTDESTKTPPPYRSPEQAEQQNQRAEQDIATGSKNTGQNSGGVTQQSSSGNQRNLLSPQEAREKIKSGESVDASRIDTSGQQTQSVPEARQTMQGDNPPESVKVQTTGREISPQEERNRTIQLGLKEGTVERRESAKDKPANELTNKDIKSVFRGSEDQADSGQTGDQPSGQASTQGGTGRQTGSGQTGTGNKDLSSIFGNEGRGQQQGGTGSKLASMFNVDLPGQQEGGQGRQSQRKQVAQEKVQQGLNREESRRQIQKQLNEQLSFIEEEYNRKREKAREKTENQRKSQISNLTSVGVTNPVSSGVASIGSASEKSLNERLDQISRAEAAEKAKARAQALGKSTQQFDKEIQTAQQELERINEQEQQQIENQQQKFENKVNLVQSKVNALQSGRKLDIQEKERTKENVLDLVENFGTAAFEGMDESELEDMAKAAGFNPSAFKSGVKNLKEKELQNKKLNMRKVGGSLYNITRGEDGKVKADLLIQDPENTEDTGSGSRGGGGSAKKGSNFSSSTDKTFDEWLQEQNEEDFKEMGFNQASANRLVESNGQAVTSNVTQTLKDEFEKQQNYKNMASVDEDFFSDADSLRVDLDQGRISKSAAKATLKSKYPEASPSVIEDQLTQDKEEEKDKSSGNTFSTNQGTYNLETETGRRKAISLGKGVVDNLVSQGKTKEQIKSKVDAIVAKKGFPNSVEQAITSYMDSEL